MSLYSLQTHDPVQGLFNLQREIDRFFHQPSGIDLGPSGLGVSPPINVFRDQQGQLVVRAEVPGIEPSAVDVSVENRVLTISGQRKRPEANEGSYHRRECRFGNFSRSLQLPADVDTQQATAECRNGLLTVTIPKLAEAKPRQVKVLVS